MVDRLPEEVVSHILAFLSLSDRKEASLVNHTWYTASLHPALLRQTVVTYRPNMSTLDVVKTLARRRTPNLVLDQIDSSFTSTEVIEESTKPLVEVLQCLTLKGSNITESVFLALIQNCHALTLLNLSCCNSLFLSGQLLSKIDDMKRLQIVLQNVTHLSLASIRHLSDVMINRFLSVCPNLEHLDLSSNQIVFRSEMFMKKPAISMSIVTYGNLENYLVEKSKQIKGLNLSRTALNEESLQSLAAIPGLQLAEMSLVCCRDIGDEGIVALAKHQTKLKYLDLSHSAEITDRAVQAICENLHNLKILKLAKCRKVTDQAASYLKYLPLLQSLDLSSCYTLTSRGLSAGLCQSPLTSLTQLNLHGCSAVRDSFVIRLTKHLPHLLSLDMSSCEITDISVYFICKYLRRLQVLHLAWCKGITDDGLLGRELGIQHEQLHQHEGECKCTRRSFGKDILNLPKVTEKEALLANWEDLKKLLGEDDGGHYQINDLRRITSLDLTSCNQVSDQSVLAMNFPELRKLTLNLCVKISDDTLRAVAVNLPSLEELSVTHSMHVSDAGIATLAKASQRLASLDVSNCENVTDLGMRALMQHARCLRHLDVSNCGGVTAATLNTMEHSMPRLQSVNKRLINDAVA